MRAMLPVSKSLFIKLIFDFLDNLRLFSKKISVKIAQLINNKIIGYGFKFINKEININSINLCSSHKYRLFSESGRYVSKNGRLGAKQG